MELAAAHAIAGTIGDDEIADDYIVPSVFNRAVAPAVAEAVARAAAESGVAQRVPSSSPSSRGSAAPARA
jgi:malate dehydrogenase (oxaloacetate-decarboxylating)